MIYTCSCFQQNEIISVILLLNDTQKTSFSSKSICIDSKRKKTLTVEIFIFNGKKRTLSTNTCVTDNCNKPTDNWYNSTFITILQVGGEGEAIKQTYKYFEIHLTFRKNNETSPLNTFVPTWNGTPISCLKAGALLLSHRGG